MRYAHLAVWGVILVAFWGLARPESAAGHAVTSVAGSLDNVLKSAGGEM